MPWSELVRTQLPLAVVQLSKRNGWSEWGHARGYQLHFRLRNDGGGRSEVKYSYLAVKIN